MGKTAMSKFAEAKELDKQADGLRKRDPESAIAMDALAHGKRKSAIKQLKRRPGKRGSRKGREVL